MVKTKVMIMITGVRLGHMKNALVEVLSLQYIQHPQVHSSYDPEDELAAPLFSLIPILLKSEISSL